ncbi:MAG: GGDEF domain-containing protein [Christensenellales bacterium]|jgi:diguanylate cyclase (GGDEF)-like protein
MEQNRVDRALGLPRADAFERDLTMMMENCLDLTLAMTDLDRMMRANEEFGCEEGDRLLIETGEHLKRTLPKDVHTYRYGGDQFAVLFPERYEKEDAFLIMEEVRRSYRAFLPDGRAQTISVGIASAPDDGASYLDLVRKAEGAMVRAKTGDANRVCLAREEKMITKTSHYTAEQLKRLTKVSKRESVGEAVLLREALDALLKKYDA